MMDKDRDYIIKFLEMDIKREGERLKKMLEVYKEESHDLENKELMLSNYKSKLI